MKFYGENELRRMYLEFFESKDHLKLDSFSLVPKNDKSLLLINAGMAPLKPYFTGLEIPPRRRITTCQKCVRTGDIENVGKTARHLTFFEMLGNFSFGDYFKHEAIAWSWEFLTKVLGMDPDRLYPSIYGEDDEAFKIWNEEIGIPEEKITRFYRDPVTGECDNFWEHGAGPCGPCSEIYYDRGVKYGCGKPDCKVGCDCDRFMEVWNNVFTQFDGDGKGGYTELKNKNIDTGMGLERLAVVVQDVDSVFDIDTMKAIRDKICELSDKTYKVNEKDDISIRLITDHIRSSTFLISDGVMPSNEGRGYVLRRIIRRAARHGRMLGINNLFMAELAKTVINESKDGYRELETKKDFILTVLTNEEKAFNKTIDQGLSILSSMEENMNKAGIKTLNGDDAFKLYDTYGFPIDLTIEILEEKGYDVDIDGFNKAMQIQKETARKARKVTTYMGADASVFDSYITKTEFTGYTTLSDNAVISIMSEDKEEDGKIVSELVDFLGEGQNGTIIADKTPFYATMGGQESDKGIIKTDEGEFEVTNVEKLVGDKYAHHGVVKNGIIKKGEKGSFEVCEAIRNATCRNHSATHLLQKALREVLGPHVEQQGSYQDSERTRFDFSHFKALTSEELLEVENIVNAAIAKDYPVVTDIMSIDDAKKSGAMALFGEKYGDSVRVVSMGDFSKELCGGTHVKNTGAIGAFKILSESGIAAGVRRIEAITSDNVFSYYANIENKLSEAAKAAKCSTDDLTKKINSLLEEIKGLQSENEKLKSKLAKNSAGNILDNVTEIGGIKVLTASISEVDMNGLRSLGDEFKSKLGTCYIFIASTLGDKVSLIAMASDDAVKAGAHAGNLIKSVASIVGGGGGGRPNMAQAGGKNTAAVDECLKKAVEVIREQLA
ncbi:MAG: alanine--tRNA ligase [Clostridiales bacterium]|nr:alanine--tRNA ligase [Clostridiales bacterium]